MKNNIAVVGSIDSILAFKTVGFDVFGVNNEENTRHVLNKLLTEYKLILITDTFAKFAEDIIKDTQNSAYPTITVIPSGTSEENYALGQISQSVERALGVNILQNEEKK